MDSWSTSIGSELDHTYSGYTFDSNAPLTFNEIELRWTAATGRLVVTFNGVEKINVVDTDFKTFKRIYVVGNDYGVYDDIVMTMVPEPATQALMVGTCGLLSLVRSRRRR